MRKILEIVSLLGLAMLAGITAGAFAGPYRLPARIPTHFGLSGQPDAWGPSWALLSLPVGAGILYVLMMLVARNPEAFHYPVRVTRANAGCLQRLALNMIAWLKAEVIWLFVCIQMVVVHAARTGHSGGIATGIMPTALGIVLGTVIGYVVAMRRFA